MVFMAKLEENHEFVTPKREILAPDDLEKWPKSSAYFEITEFIIRLNTAVMGKKISTPITPSRNVEVMVGVLNKLSDWIDETPAIDQPQRFGNKAFKTWYQLLNDRIQDVLRSALEEKHHPALDEITIYLIESFGNSTRIDYGSGHEMNFILFMYCLFRIGALEWENTNDQMGAVLRIFDTYMALARKLQRTYRMEPAGSHGAWSLDDYQFVPFIWGSAQLMRNDKIQPSQMGDLQVVEQNKSEYMLFGCIDYILQVKTGPFHEHSNQLWNISGVETWTKVNSGLIKMYKGEIISKFPIIQHVLFGSLISIKQVERVASTFPLATPFRVPPPGTGMFGRSTATSVSSSIGSIDSGSSGDGDDKSTSSSQTEGRSSSTGDSSSSAVSTSSA